MNPFPNFYPCLYCLLLMTLISFPGHGKGGNVASVNTHDWSQWRGPSYNGIANGDGTSLNWGNYVPKQLWKTSIGIGFSSIVASNGRLYTMGNIDDIDIIYCVDVKTGTMLWTHRYSSPLASRMYEGGPNATPSIDDGKVYTLARTGHCLSLDAQTGKVIWSRMLRDEVEAEPPKFGFSGSPLVIDDLIILNVGKSGLALNKANGEVVWQSSTTGAGYSTPARFEINDIRGVAIFNAQAMTGVDPGNGKILWSYPWSTSHDINAADPVFLNDQMFMSSAYLSRLLLSRV